MSYLRWINSPFYCYWCATESKVKEEQILQFNELTGCVNLRYADIKTNPTASLKKVVDAYANDPYITLRDWRDAIEAIEDFVKDIEEEYRNE